MNFIDGSEKDEKTHICLMSNHKENEVTTLLYKQMYDLSVKLNKENDELERNILIYKNHVKSLEEENDRVNNDIYIYICNKF